MNFDRNPTAGFALMGAGLASVLYGLFYAAWSGLSFLMSLKSALMWVLPELMEGQTWALWVYGTQLVQSGVQMLAFLVLAALSGVTVFGGWKVVKHEAQNVAWVGIGSAVVIPGLALVVNYGHFVQVLMGGSYAYAPSRAVFEVVGTIVSGSLYNVPTFGLLVANLIIAMVAGWVVLQPDYQTQATR